MQKIYYGVMNLTLNRQYCLRIRAEVLAEENVGMFVSWQQHH